MLVVITFSVTIVGCKWHQRESIYFHTMAHGSLQRSTRLLRGRSSWIGGPWLLPSIHGNDQWIQIFFLVSYLRVIKRSHRLDTSRNLAIWKEGDRFQLLLKDGYQVAAEFCSLFVYVQLLLMSCLQRIKSNQSESDQIRSVQLYESTLVKASKITVTPHWNFNLKRNNTTECGG